MDAWKVAAGAVFLAASSVSFMETSLFATRTPFLIGAVTALLFAIGALALGIGSKTPN